MMTSYRSTPAQASSFLPQQDATQSGRHRGTETGTMYIFTQQSRFAVRTAACGISLAALVLTGCGTGLGANGANAVAPLTRATINGVVHGGQNPISGSTIKLFTVGTSGARSASTNILNTTVTTDSGGGFSISTDYDCAASSGTQVYITATGGNSGGPAPTPSNGYIALMAPLGSCAALQTAGNSVNILINEITTVAGVYALAPFIGSTAAIGATGSNPVGLVNAFTLFNQLANLANGTPGGTALPTGATVPSAEIITLANIIAACVNSASPYAACTAIQGSTGGSDTLGFALGFANNPGSTALLNLWNYGSAVAPFVGGLSAQPNDWTMAIKYATGFAAPYGVAVDAYGNAWVANSSGSSVVELTPSGTASTFSPTGLIGPKGIAIDRSNNVWIAGAASNSVSELSNAGATLGTFTVGGLNGPVAIAMDSAGNAWIANLAGNSVTELSSGGATQTSLTAGGTISGPTGIALDSTGNVYVANSGGGNVVKLTHAGATGTPLNDVALQGTSAVAIDTSGNVWAPGSTTGTAVTGSVSQFNSAGVAASSSPLAAGGLNLPTGVATTGTNVWVTNGATAGSLSYLQAGQTAPLSPSTGFGSLNAPIGVAVDPSGNVWTANSGDNSVSCFVGLTTPAVTPLAANVGP
jgi:streptogramin lyase